MTKITIVLEFDNINPTTQDIINYINECGRDLDYTIEKGLLWFVGTNGREIIHILICGIGVLGYLSTRKVINAIGLTGLIFGMVYI